MWKGKGLQLCSPRGCLCCIWWYLNNELGTWVMDGPLKLHWSRRCRSTVSSLPANYWIITKASTSQQSAGPLSSYPTGQNTHLGRKVVLVLPSWADSNKSRSVTTYTHATCTFYFWERSSTQFGRINCTLQSCKHMCARYWDLNHLWIIWSTMQIKIK